MPVQVTTITVSTETTIVTSAPGNSSLPSSSASNLLTGLVITTPDATGAGTLTLRDGTGGTIRLLVDYPNATLAPGTPFVIQFPTPIAQAVVGNNWTLTCSVAGTYHVNAFYIEQ